MIELLQKVGFPIFVAGWFMFRHEKRMDRQSAILNKVLLAMQMLARTVEDAEPHRHQTTNRMSTQPPFWEDEESATTTQPMEARSGEGKAG